jgi:hypothetical protein
VKQAITITASSGLSEREIDRMVKDAQAYEAEDSRRREQVDTHNQLDGLLYNIEKLMGENADKLADGDRTRLEQAIAEGKQALASGDLERMKAAIDAVTRASHRMAESMYQGAPGASQGAHTPPPPQQRADDGVIDAEFTPNPWPLGLTDGGGRLETTCRRYQSKKSKSKSPTSPPISSTPKPSPKPSAPTSPASAAASRSSPPATAASSSWPSASVAPSAVPAWLMIV